MRHRWPTEQELRQSFHAELERVVAGGGVRSCTGLDNDTSEALWAIASAEPADRGALVPAAYRAFAGQLDGSNAARWHEDLERRFEEREQRRQGEAD
ncbi:hypothetical protein BX285_6889 [Streptomyces sp. 1114.5]|uniref:hypothetical protein n=1 Tax=unclassified Streptomyces TaxID=2593676 RepID=UPI000BCF6DE8|nr:MULTISPECIES: hypothetical protein [unclassified Streptomyces]RKT09784.1 hypothetical protein BX285_6889 [Streptomyces sp. 1114.5]SOB88866.1 hypothetical protein SAMN06272789_7187 [Streptomyces sp. 1331.2]